MQPTIKSEFQSNEAKVWSTYGLPVTDFFEAMVTLARVARCTSNVRPVPVCFVLP